MDIIGVIKNSHLLNVTIVRFKMEFTDWRSLGLDRYPWSSSTGRSYRRSGKLMYNHLKCAKNEENRISIYCTFLSHLIESLMLVILRQGTSPQYQYCYLDLVIWYYLIRVPHAKNYTSSKKSTTAGFDYFWAVFYVGLRFSVKKELTTGRI